MYRYVSMIAACAVVIACTSRPAARPTLPEVQETFWAALAGLCGQAYQGTVTESAPPDTSFAGKALVMHVRECGGDTTKVPFHVGLNRSRTWVFTRTGTGLRLKHDHRHEDGTEDSLTQYGGDTAGEGAAGRQEFLADSATAAMLPVAATNVWTVEIHPGQRFVYALRREGTTRRFRVEFDLSQPVPVPPAPWGHR